MTHDGGAQADRREFGLHARAARGAVSNYAGQFVALASAVLLTPIILHNVGPAYYSLWVLANALTGYGGLLDLGISSTVQKYVAEHRARKTNEELSRIISTVLALYAGLGLLALAVFAALAPLIPALVGAQGDLRRVAVWLTVLAGAQVALTLCAAVPMAVLRGAQRFELANAVSIGATLSTAALTILVLQLGAGIVAVAAVGVGVTVVLQAPAFWLVRRVAPDLRLDLGGVTRARIRTVFSFSSSVFGARVADLLTRRTDPFVIGAALPVRLITPYALAQRLPEAASILTNQFVQVLLPIASDLDARDEQRTLRALYLTASRIAVAFSVAGAATMAILGPSILDVWVGSDYSRYGNIVAILAATTVLDTIGWPAASVLTGIGRHRPLAWMAIANGVANVGLSVILVFPLGLTGVALGTLLPTALETAFLVLPYSLRTIGVGGRTFVARVVVPNLVPAATITVALLAARVVFDTDRPGVLLGAIAVAFLAYCAAYLRFSAGRSERRFYRQVGTDLWSAATGGRRS